MRAGSSASLLADSFDAKIVLLGAAAAGKTSLVMQYVNGTFSQTEPSVGGSFLTKKIVLEVAKGKRVTVRLQIWDTAGQERYKSVAPMYYRDANAALVVYDCHDSRSFESTKMWIQELKKNVTSSLDLSIVANKIDLGEEVSFEQASGYASSVGARFSKTSAKTREGVDELFLSIAERLYEQREQVSGESSSSTSGDGQPYGSVRLDKKIATREKSSCC